LANEIGRAGKRSDVQENAAESRSTICRLRLPFRGFSDAALVFSYGAIGSLQLALTINIGFA